MSNYDFQCSEGHVHEISCSFADKPNEVNCPECGAIAKYVILQTPSTLTKIIPDYPGCKKVRAGYQHSHGDYPAEKIQVGYGPKNRIREKPKDYDKEYKKNDM